MNHASTRVRRLSRLVGLLLLGGTCAVSGFAQGTPVTAFQDSFETDGSGSRYLVENGADNGEADFFARRQEFSNGTVASGGTVDGDWVFGARDIDNATNFTSSVSDLLAQEGRLTWTGIDIRDLGNVRVDIAVAEGGEGFEPNNTMLVAVRIDGGEWINIGGFRSTGTNDAARYFVGDENTLTASTDTRLVPEFADFSWDMLYAGSTLDLRLTFNSNADAEDYYIDNVRVIGERGANAIAATVAQPSYVEPAVGESIATAINLTLSSPAPAGGLAVGISGSFLLGTTTDLPTSVTVPAGATTLSIPFNILQDEQYTGTKVIEVDFDATGYGTRRLRFRVENNTPQPRVVMMEIMNIVPGVTELDLVGDSNGDGIRNASNEAFVEIVNFEDFPVDISGWTISDDLGTRHEFPEGSVIGAGRALVVFGGGNPTGIFGGASVQTASSGLLAFNSNRPEVATLVATLGGFIETVDLLIDGDIFPIDPRGGSIHRSTGEIGAPFAVHSTIAGSENRPYSPGTLPNGEPYFVPENTLSLTIDRPAILEDAGANAATATVSLASPAPAEGLTVMIESNGFTIADDGSINPDEITVASTTVEIAGGASSATFTIGAFDDELLDGDRTVRIVVRSGPDILPALALLEVQDIEPNPFNVIISEVMPMVLGTGTDLNRNGVLEEVVGDKFIELVNMSGFIVDMSGWQIRVSETGSFTPPEIVHTFPAGSRLNDQGAAVIFGRATEETFAARDTVYGGALIQTASNPDGSQRANGLALQRNQDTTIELLNVEGFRVAEFAYDSDLGYQAMSITRAPDLNGPLTLHLAATGGEFRTNSPGNRVDGSAYAVAGEAPAEEVTPETAPIADGPTVAADQPDPIPGRFVNVSTRAFVGVDGEPLITGFVIEGEQSTTVLVRAIGPGLELVAPDFPNEIQDPQVAVYRAAGADGPVEILSNDDWSDGPNAELLRQSFSATGAFALAEESRDAALLLNLAPGAYTVVVTAPGQAHGIVLLEVYELR
ncbi:lamin tail domain-containing protein [Synoicihabitans lomoniglobus]|uniref:Lamin tail domain-containing protein n=1 Tax=Synoicihabitans lomoniglobus TaxID=2909285 RepID=A0AAF0A0P8_9BACT|nr:lamin tail domain-containing protein [Opitutaceae bacterium LMO-M01]WED65158.1 lamin tail domain-containing protein [Opitutaceae bacterium LMO-M01]